MDTGIKNCDKLKRRVGTEAQTLVKKQTEGIATIGELGEGGSNSPDTTPKVTGGK